MFLSREMGRKEREALKQMAEVAREGFELKKALMEEASKRKEEKQVRTAVSGGGRFCWGSRSGGFGCLQGSA